MNNSSTDRPPKLERLLLDGDITTPLEELIKRVGFDAVSARKLGVILRSDTLLLQYAKLHNFFAVVCHDTHGDRATREELYPELYHRGGRIIRIGGGPQQDAHLALGKFLVHAPRWREWFETNQGIYVCQRDKAELYPGTRLYQFIYRDPAVQKPTPAVPKKGKRSKTVSLQQAHMPIP
jgi:hypothetical protein